MNKEEIKAIIDKYDLVRRGDKVGTYKRGVDQEQFLREVAQNKAEILQYILDEEKAAAEAKAKRKETFEAIPGVKEIRDARIKRSRWRSAFNRMMESGDGRMEPVSAPSESEIEALEEQYPMAVFALEAEYRAANTQNYELSKIWKKSYEGLLDGKKPESVKAEHDDMMSKFVASKIWD